MNRGQVVNNGKVAVFACGVQAGLSTLDKERNRKKEKNKCAKSLTTLQKKRIFFRNRNKNKYCRGDTFYEVIKDYSSR